MGAAFAEPYMELPPELEPAAVDLAKSLAASDLLPLECDGEIIPQLHSRYLIKGLLSSAAKIVVFGLPGCGKSFFAYDVGRHVSREREWFGRRTRRGRVVYLAAEGQAGLRLRHAAWNLTYPADAPDPFALIPTAVDLLDPKADLPKLRATMEAFANRFGGLDLLVVDTLAATFGGGDENGSDMAAYVANIEKLCVPYGCSSLIVTHAPLDVTAKRPRGHGSLWGAADCVLHISGDREAPARRIHVLKAKDCDPGPDLMFTLKQIEIGIDEDGDPVTSCILEQSELEPGQVIGKRRLSAKEKIVKDALDRALVASGVFPPAEIPDNVLDRVRIGKVVRLSEWQSEAYPALASPDIDPDTPRRYFGRAKEALQAAEIVGIWEDWAWLIF